MQSNYAKILTLVLLFIAALISATEAEEQDYPRQVLLEQFNSMTCRWSICNEFDAWTNLLTGLSEGVISLRYQYSNDPLTTAAGDWRRQVLGVSGMPIAVINGTTLVTAGSFAEYSDLVQAAKGQRSLVNILIERDFTNPTDVEVRVTVQSSIEFINHRLFVALNNRMLYLPDIGSQITGHNGQTLFHDIFMGFVSPDEGEALAGGFGGEQTFSYRYQPGSGDFWPAGQTFITAFVQDMNSGEIMQAGTDFGGEASPELTIADAFERVPNSSQITKKLNISNTDEFEQEFRLSIFDQSFIPDDWSVELSRPVIRIPGGGSASVDLILTSPSAASYVHVLVQVIGEARSDGLAPTFARAATGLLTENTDIAHYIGYNALQDAQLQALWALTAYSNRTAAMPIHFDGVVTNFPVTEFDAALFSLASASSSVERSDLILGMATEMYRAGKGVFVSSELSGRNSFLDGGDQTFFADVLGVEHLYDFARNQGGVLRAFDINGLDNDPITDGIAFQSNSSEQNLVVYTDVFRIPFDSRAETIFVSDSLPKSVVGMRVADESSARAVYLSFGLEAIADEKLRALTLNRILDWILGIEAEIESDSEAINFGRVALNSRKSESIEFTNSGQADLIVRTELSGDHAAYFAIAEPDVVEIRPGASASITVNYTPAEEQAHSASLLVFSNASNEREGIEIPLLGNGVLSSVEGLPVAESELLSLAVGPNPFHGTSLIRYAVKGEKGRYVRLALINAVGRQIRLLDEGFREPGSHRLSLNTAELPAGAYMLELSTASGGVVLPVLHLK